jgi:DNA-binding Lrp family transcriptional regulator
MVVVILMGRKKQVQKDTDDLVDRIDKEILNIIQDNATLSLEDIGKRLGMSKTAVHYRLNKLREKKVIKKIMALVEPNRLGYDISAISLIKARFGPNYQKIVGEKLRKIKGVWAVYFLLGDIDFVVMIRAKNRNDLLRIIDQFINIPEIERSSTHLILETFKEDPKLELD